MRHPFYRLLVLLGALCAPASAQDSPEGVEGWLSWRGPLQSGVSLETGLFDEVEIDGKNHQWSVDLCGRGTPVIAGDRLYSMGYRGVEGDLLECIVCMDARTGEQYWERTFRDYLSDVIYDRYAISAPTVDPATGNVYCITTGGLLCAFTPDGELIWERALNAHFGRITFPNGRTGSPLIDGDRLILHIITAHWGRTEGPARDRFYCFDKNNGRHIWSQTPGTPPKDSPYSYPVIEWRDGRRLIYAGTGCGNLVCMDARTGAAIWRYKVATGGVNSSVLLDGDNLIAIHGRENLDSSVIGRLLSVKLGAGPAPGEAGPKVLDKSCENWRIDRGAFTSSPVLVGRRLYETIHTGELICVDVDEGKELWHKKLAPDQIHASPLAADGKLYVPMNNGSFWVLRPSDEGIEVLSEVMLAGNALGAPALYNGRLYVHTTEKLYCFGYGQESQVPPVEPVSGARRPGGPTGLMVEPGDILLRVGDEMQYTVSSVDALGSRVSDHPKDLEWDLPPIITASGGTNDRPTLKATGTGVGVISVNQEGMRGSSRVRVVEALPIDEDFESYPLEKAPGHWLGGVAKWEVLERDGSKVLARKMDNPLFQRTISFIGHPNTSNYTMKVDVMTDGNRRSMSSAGVIHQRYQISLKGNYREIEVSSNMERLKVSKPYRVKAGTWYTLLTRVDVNDDGSGTVRAKVWVRGEEEPAEWTIEVPHNDAHVEGSPGIYGFTPQSQFRVYLDNLTVTQNE